MQSVNIAIYNIKHNHGPFSNNIFGQKVKIKQLCEVPRLGTKNVPVNVKLSVPAIIHVNYLPALSDSIRMSFLNLTKNVFYKASSTSKYFLVVSISIFS